MRCKSIGRAASGSAVNGAGADTTTLTPLSVALAGRSALITTLRARLAHNGRDVNAHKTQDAQLAARVRSMPYSLAGAGCQWAECRLAAGAPW